MQHRVNPHRFASFGNVRGGGLSEPLVDGNLGSIFRGGSGGDRNHANQDLDRLRNRSCVDQLCVYVKNCLNAFKDYI
jgi:hypothetical protein